MTSGQQEALDRVRCSLCRSAIRESMKLHAKGTVIFETIDEVWADFKAGSNGLYIMQPIRIAIKRPS